MHTATDGRNGLFAPLLSRLRFTAIRGDSRRFVAIRGDLLISDTVPTMPGELEDPTWDGVDVQSAVDSTTLPLASGSTNCTTLTKCV